MGYIVSQTHAPGRKAGVCSYCSLVESSRTGFGMKFGDFLHKHLSIVSAGWFFSCRQLHVAWQQSSADLPFPLTGLGCGIPAVGGMCGHLTAHWCWSPSVYSLGWHLCSSQAGFCEICCVYDSHQSL